MVTMREFPGPIIAFTLAILPAATVFFVNSTSVADDKITQLKTFSGLLVSRKAMGSDCGADASFADECTALYLNEKLLLAEKYVTIERAFPTSTDPKLVSISTATGGNACCWTSYIFDFTKKPPLKFEGSFDSDIVPATSGVTFTMVSSKDALGDWLVDTYTYKFGSGHSLKIREEPRYVTTPIEDKETPEEVLGDPKVREPIIRLIGTSYFSTFRNTVGVAKSLQTVNGNFIVGSGCYPHDCIDRYAMFILDIANKLAWAVEGSGFEDKSPTARIWGPLTPSDIIPKREIANWLTEHKIPAGSARYVTLPESVSEFYKQPRKQIAITTPTATTAPPKPVNPSEPQPPKIEGSPQGTVALQTNGGTFVVPVTINGELTLNFTIDSGAADVSIPVDVAMTLLRTGTLNRQDFLGSQTYRLADGSTIPSQTFRIRSLKVGERVLENVTGSIAPAAGSLLLGQSFLSRFKSWSIDNQRQVLLLD